MSRRCSALARTEVDGNFRAIVSLIAIVGTIPVLLIVTFFLGLDAAVKLLAVPLGAEAPAALIVAAPFLVIALGLGWMGARRMALSNLEPWRTWRQVKRDVREVTRAGA
ncbi:phage holin family protein [Methylobacterium oryzae CBMB20]